MSEREVILLVFAPATVGLIVMAVRRMPRIVYWATLFGVITLMWVGIGPSLLGPDSTVASVFVFGLVFAVAPTFAAFGVGRLVALNLGGAYVFAASCSAFVFALGLAAGIVSLSRLIAP